MTGRAGRFSRAIAARHGARRGRPAVLRLRPATAPRPPRAVERVTSPLHLHVASRRVPGVTLRVAPRIEVSLRLGQPLAPPQGGAPRPPRTPRRVSARPAPVPAPAVTPLATARPVRSSGPPPPPAPSPARVAAPPPPVARVLAAPPAPAGPPGADGRDGAQPGAAPQAVLAAAAATAQAPAPTPVAPDLNLDGIADRVIATIDRRVIAHRERLGRAF